MIESIDEHRRAKRRSGSPLATVEEAIEEFRRGRFVIIVDDEGRENEGDLTIPAQFVTPETISFMLRYTTGVICVPMTGERLDELHIPMMVGQLQNQAQFGTAFTVSVDAHSRHGVTTGISAHDRAKVVQVLIDPNYGSDDIVMPGHMFPLRARDGASLSVLVRRRPPSTSASWPASPGPRSSAR